jgi:hypothetical protein
MPTTVTMTGPGTTTIVDDAAAAITAQTNALTTTMTANNTKLIAELVFIDAAINQINNNVAKLVERSTSISKAISDLEATTSVSAAGQSSLNALQATAIANQIKTNNFQMAVTKEALTRTGQPLPVLPDFEEQLKESVGDAISLNTISTAQGAVTSFINSTVTGTTELIAGTETFKGISSWLSKQKDVILGAIIPPSAATLASNAAAQAGQKVIVGGD